MEFWQEFSPLQWEYSKHFTRSFDRSYDKNLFECIADFNGLPNYDDLKLAVPENTPIANMASNPITGSLLQFLIQTRNIKRVLEIGTYIGISAIKMAQVLPSEGRILTIEKGIEFIKLAETNISQNKHQAPIYISIGDALPLISQWALVATMETEDLIFLDADKERYHLYLEPIKILLRHGGLLVVDDVLFHGDVLNKEPKTEKGKGCKLLLERVKELAWPIVLLPIANGVLLMQKPLA